MTIDHVETETLDRLFLELSQFTKAKTAQEIKAQEIFRRATLLHTATASGQQPSVSLRFETDEDAERARDLIIKLRNAN